MGIGDGAPSTVFSFHIAINDFMYSVSQLKASKAFLADAETNLNNIMSNSSYY